MVVKWVLKRENSRLTLDPKHQLVRRKDSLQAQDNREFVDKRADNIEKFVNLRCLSRKTRYTGPTVSSAPTRLTKRYCSAAMQMGDSIVLEEEVDPDYEPTAEEVEEYARWLGMDPAADEDLLHIAREGLKAPLPPDWKPCKSAGSDDVYYFNFKTGDSTWDHPSDSVSHDSHRPST